MALIHSLETEGNYLFKYRGQFPLLLFLGAIPVIYFTDYKNYSYAEQLVFTGISIVISFLGFLIRAYTIGTAAEGTSGRNTQEQIAKTVNTTGIYSILRHPLYLGNYLIWIGIVLFTFNIYFVIIVTLAYWIYYERIMFAEERFLEKKFGDAYIHWSKEVSAFIPSFKKMVPSKNIFSIKIVLRREYSGVLATVIGFVFIDFLRNSFAENKIIFSETNIYILIISVAITLLLRTLKHHTKTLN